MEINFAKQRGDTNAKTKYFMVAETIKENV